MKSTADTVREKEPQEFKLLLEAMNEVLLSLGLININRTDPEVLMNEQEKIQQC